MDNLDKVSVITLSLPSIWTVTNSMSQYAMAMLIFLAMAAKVMSLVCPDLNTKTTAWLSQCVTTFFPPIGDPRYKLQPEYFSFPNVQYYNFGNP